MPVVFGGVLCVLLLVLLVQVDRAGFSTAGYSFFFFFFFFFF